MGVRNQPLLGTYDKTYRAAGYAPCPSSRALEEAIQLGDGLSRYENILPVVLKISTVDSGSRFLTSRQNMPLSWAIRSGTTCRTSQCSTILPPSSKRKMSMPAQSRSLSVGHS